MTPATQTHKNAIGSELVREDPSFADIVEQFVEGLGNRITGMEEAIRAADFEALRVAAHQLKGSGGGYGYPVLTQHAAELERDAKATALEKCVKTLEELKQLCGRIVVDPEEQSMANGD